MSLGSRTWCARGRRCYRIALEPTAWTNASSPSLNDVERPEDLQDWPSTLHSRAPNASSTFWPLRSLSGPAQTGQRSARRLAKGMPAMPGRCMGFPVKSRFGVRGSEHHDGIDIAAPAGNACDQASRRGQGHLFGAAAGLRQACSGRRPRRRRGERLCPPCSQILVAGRATLVRTGQTDREGRARPGAQLGYICISRYGFTPRSAQSACSTCRNGEGSDREAPLSRAGFRACETS